MKYKVIDRTRILKPEEPVEDVFGGEMVGSYDTPQLEYLELVVPVEETEIEQEKQTEVYQDVKTVSPLFIAIGGVILLILGLAMIFHIGL